MEVRQITSPRGGRKYEVDNPDGSTTTLASVTTILGALPKGGLDWWGFKLGIQAMQEMAKAYGAGDQDDAPGYLWDSVQSMSLDDWYADAKKTDYAPHKALKNAAGRGTDVHAVAEVLLRDGKLDALPANTTADSGYVDALLAWHDAHNVDEWRIVSVEARMYSIEHGFAGTADVIAERLSDGVYVIGDFKTSKGIYPSHLLQATAYGAAAVERGLVPADAVIEPQVIRLGIDGSYEVQRSRYSIEDFAAVKAVHSLLADKSKSGVPVNGGE